MIIMMITIIIIIIIIIIIDVSIPPDRNTSTKVIEKLSKYKDLEIETMRMWGMRTETVPFIVGALGPRLEGEWTRT